MSMETDAHQICGQSTFWRVPLPMHSSKGWNEKKLARRRKRSAQRQTDWPTRGTWVEAPRTGWWSCDGRPGCQSWNSCESSAGTIETAITTPAQNSIWWSHDKTRKQSEPTDLRQGHVVRQVAAPHSVWQRFPLCPTESNVNENFKVVQNSGFQPDHPQNWITGSFCHSRHSQKI